MQLKVLKRLLFLVCDRVDHSLEVETFFGEDKGYAFVSGCISVTVEVLLEKLILVIIKFLKREMLLLKIFEF